MDDDAPAFEDYDGLAGTPLLPPPPQTAPPPDTCLAPVLTRQDLRALGIAAGEDGRLAVQRTARSSSKGRQAALMAAAAAAGGGGGVGGSVELGADPRAVLQALGALIRVGGYG